MNIQQPATFPAQLQQIPFSVFSPVQSVPQHISASTSYSDPRRKYVIFLGLFKSLNENQQFYALVFLAKQYELYGELENFFLMF